MASIQCEAMAVLRDLKESFEQLYEDINQYQHYSKSINVKLDSCKGVMRNMDAGTTLDAAESTQPLASTPPTRSGPPPGFDESCGGNDDDGVEVSPVHDQGIQLNDSSDHIVPEPVLPSPTRSTLEQEVQDAIAESEQLLQVAIIKEEASEREEIVVFEKTASSRLVDELDEIQIMNWQNFTKSNTDVANNKKTTTTIDMQQVLIEAGEWKAKTDPKSGHTYFYMPSNKKKRVWNLRKYAETEIAAGRMNHQGNVIDDN